MATTDPRCPPPSPEGPATTGASLPPTPSPGGDCARPGEGDAAVVYSTDVTPASAPKITAIPIADPLNVVATYPIARVTTGANPKGGAAFIDFVQSPDGQKTLEKWGFGHASP